MNLVTVDKKFEYEVAFSFLKEDELLATQVNDLIKQRASTFLYTERQKEAMSKDAYVFYTKTYLEEARIVVVFYQEGWGTTEFTRIEEGAIKQRQSKEGFEFVFFVSLDGKKPIWVPTYQIWYNYKKDGIDALVSHIEYQIHQRGGHVRIETLEDQEARQSKALKRIDERNSYLLSPNGFKDGVSEVKKLLKKVEEIHSKKMTGQNQISFGNRIHPDWMYMPYYNDIGLEFLWHQAYGNSLVNSHLLISIDKFSGNRRNSSEEIRKPIKPSKKYIFYLNELGEKGWVNQDTKTDFKATEQLVEEYYKEFYELAYDAHIKTLKDKSLY